MEGLQIGRTVHYVDGTGRHCAAIITGIVNVTTGDVWLEVFPPGERPFCIDATHSVKTTFVSTWHWPERV